MRFEIISAWLIALLFLRGSEVFSAVFTVTNTADSGSGTLREAILQANSNPGLDTIVFAISGAGVQRIAPATRLPNIVDPVTIDGYSQPGAQPNTLSRGDNAVLLIKLDGAGVRDYGLRVDGGNTTIRGLVIDRFETGVYLAGASNTIVGNFIGTNPTGTLPAGNFIGLTVAGSSTTVGGMTPDARNLVSGNRWIGIGVLGSFDNFVLGNYIGTDASGSIRLGNQWGLDIGGGWNVIIGGTGAGSANVISGNSEFGILIDGCGPFCSFISVFGNYVGVGADGISALGNGSDGVRISSGANTYIGDLDPGAGNIIAYSGGAGVGLESSSSSNLRQTILGNSIFSNAVLGIDLGENGVTLNDPGDADTGPNAFQNFPALTLLQTSSNLTVLGTLNSASNTTYTIQVFNNQERDPSGYGQGEALLDTVLVTTDDTGDADFTLVFDRSVLSRPWFSATATDPNGNTSEFSRAAGLTPPFIFEEPTNQTVRVGSKVTFRASADGMGPLVHQWHFNDTAISFGTNAVLVITNVQLADAGAYSLSVTNPLGHAESGQAVLTVYSPPIILQQPQSQRVVQGDTVSFIVGASGTPPPLRYAWSFNGVGVPGQTNASIVLTNVQLRNAGVYKVSVTTIFDSVVSSNAILSVLLDSDGDHMPDVW